MLTPSDTSKFNTSEMMQQRQSITESMLQPAKISRMGQLEDGCWNTLPNDVKLLILEHIPMLKLAQMACLCKEFHAAYRARVALRQTIIDGLPRVSLCTPGSRPASLGDLIDSLPPSSTALPRDLVGVREMKENLQVYPLPFSLEIPLDLDRGAEVGHFVGFSLRGMREGPGEWTSTSARYLGAWQGAMIEGQGEAWLSSPQENYFGQWHLYSKHGHGEATWEGAKYIGTWRDNFKHGTGEYTWGDDGRYVGGFELGEFHGHGIKTEGGESYVGNFVYGVKEGLGVKVWPAFPHNITYAGEWMDGQVHGQGAMSFGDGSKYAGAWENSHMVGQGAMTYPDGSKYVGEWEDSQRHGWGAQKWASGKEYTGLWEDDEPVE